MIENTRFDVVMIGHLAQDRNVVDGHATIESGGGVYFGSVVLKRIGVNVAVVTRLHPKDLPRLDELKQAGIQVFATPAPETSGIENLYSSVDMERRTCRPLGFAGAFQADEIPDVSAQVYMIASIIAGEVDLSLLKLLASRGSVGLDVQGFVRVREGNDLVFRYWPDMREGLKRVAYLKVDRAEAELLTGQTDLQEAARQLASYGPREIVVTQSSGVTVYADGRFFTAPFTPRTLAGRTGRGDTCFSTYIGKRLTSSPDVACKWAAAITTLKQEKPGPWRGTLAEAEALIARM